MENSNKTLLSRTGFTDIGEDHFGRYQFQGKEYMVKNSDNLSDEEIHKCLVELQIEESEKNAVTLVYSARSYNAEPYVNYDTKKVKPRKGSNKKTPKHKKAKNGRTKKRRK